MTRRLAFCAGLTAGACLWMILASCTPPPPGAIPPASVDTAWELNDWMETHPVTDLNGRTIAINDGVVRPPAGSTLRNGRLVRTVDRNQKVWPHVRVTADDVTLELLVIEGAVTTPQGQPAPIPDIGKEEQHGIELDGATDVTIRAVAISDVWGDGIYLHHDTRQVDAEGIVIDSVGRAGIAVTHGRDITFDNVNIDRAGRWMVNLEPEAASWTVRNFTLTRHTTPGFGARQHWLNAAGPSLQSTTFDCQLTATIDRPTGLVWFNQHQRIAPCVTGLQLTGSF